MSLQKLIDLHDNTNIAKDLDDLQLKEIGSKVCKDYEMDKTSRADWEALMEKAMKIAKQTFDRKTFPWDNASNVKYPLIPTAVINSASRIYQEIIKGEKVVHATVIGKDPDGTATDRADRISRHMSHQLLIESDEWEDSTDRLLVMVAFLGTVFRKTYYDPLNLTICSDVCSPQDIVIHDSVKSLESARRVSHIIYKYDNDIISYINAGIYRDVSLEVLKEDTSTDEDAAHQFIEQHRYLDLDDDGYAEPYIVTVHIKSQEVLRINSRWDMENVKLNAKGKVIKIEPVHYFSDYHWLHSPDGAYYSMGFWCITVPTQ
jgi:chaperonin GroES